jgi:hypothetical protein
VKKNIKDQPGARTSSHRDAHGSPHAGSEADRAINSARIISARQLLLQVLLLLAIWAYLFTLHLDNDGLWFQGDAPRHAVTGFFWLDYLRDFTPDAKGYALSYYARYPAIDPVSRPPVFYLLEAAAFALLGPSPYVAKNLVLAFSLLSAVYLMAWLRHWISPRAGWAAGLLLLLPGMTTWSHATMLNVPALALGLGAVYHARHWLEARSRRRPDFLVATLLTLLGILTYYPAGVVVIVIAFWMALQRDWRRPGHDKVLLVAGISLFTLLPFVWLTAHWAQVQLGWLLPSASHLAKLSTWTFYPLLMPQIVNLHIICLAGIGLFTGLAQKRWRREVIILTSWIAVLYLVFSILYAKDIRYALPVMVPLVILCAIGIHTASDWMKRRLRMPGPDGRKLTTTLILVLLLSQAYLVGQHTVPSVSGYRELVAFLEQAAPAEPLFYEGHHDGIFTFYVRAGDENFQRRVVLGSKLLYASAKVPGWQQQNFVNSPEDVIRVLREQGGARWLAVEIPARGQQSAPVRALHEALGTSDFELVRSFPIDARSVKRVDVYRLRLPVSDVKEVELPFPVLGTDVRYRTRPVTRGYSD